MAFEYILIYIYIYIVFVIYIYIFWYIYIYICYIYIYFLIYIYIYICYIYIYFFDIYIYIVFVQAGQLRMFLLFSHPVKSDLYDPVKSDLFMTPWAAAHQASLCLTVSWSLPKFMSITSMMPSSHLILWCPLLLHSVFPHIRDFSNEASACIWWPKYWSFSFHIRPSNEYSGLIFLKTDLFDLLAVQGTCRSLI